MWEGVKKMKPDSSQQKEKSKWAQIEIKDMETLKQNPFFTVKVFKDIL